MSRHLALSNILYCTNENSCYNNGFGKQISQEVVCNCVMGVIINTNITHNRTGMLTSYS